ncbi:tripartite tricarboxylate transporter substrate binding protein [uncultured Lentibacter sp.]|jgi:tripartite-type tricarboxylate transporter receptor subunit TctC|uniref:Bug family tripartite tricarboxylate transporter substrate binding protein n=1 Tax=uncultured Lentibacter sp. TaxID=1659309 RepID=UPI002609814B|nr:tripartite tricarboxylate transporter substrate-binding protein [uncultured Lentibacter sp.]
MQNYLKGALAALTLSLGLTAAPATAESWAPEGPIKMIIAFNAGGGADTHARLVAEDLQTTMGWDVIPEQITGKGGLNALVALRDMPADGTAIALVVTESLGYNARAAKSAGITPTDFTPLTTTAGFQMGIIAKADRGWTTFGDVLGAAKAGEDIRFGVMSPKLADLAYVIGAANDVAFNIIEVKGGRATLDGVIAGDMDVSFVAGAQGKAVASGALVNLASAMSEPLKQTPDAPLLAAYNVPFNANGHFAFVAPKGLPEAARTALSEAIAKATASGKASGMIKKAFGGNVNIMGADLQSLLERDYDAAGALMEAAQ